MGQPARFPNRQSSWRCVTFPPRRRAGADVLKSDAALQLSAPGRRGSVLASAAIEEEEKDGDIVRFNLQEEETAGWRQVISE